MVLDVSNMVSIRLHFCVKHSTLCSLDFSYQVLVNEKQARRAFLYGSHRTLRGSASQGSSKVVAQSDVFYLVCDTQFISVKSFIIRSITIYSYLLHLHASSVKPGFMIMLSVWLKPTSRLCLTHWHGYQYIK